MADVKTKDDLLYCEHCAISFLWSSEEQKQQPEMPTKMPTTKFCPGCRRLLPSVGRERGLVKWFNHRKQFGFIVRRNAAEIFAPASEIQKPQRLNEGDLVEFSVGSSERGPVAQEIRLLQSTATAPLHPKI